ncbi:uncharacterized protein LOC142612434 [Castanea sativa]|uniref:uncharacterized protein LOC142612434 n=1 Tax=Castanea sativa TaxID=21020 RepID=UPI003F6493B3
MVSQRGIEVDPDKSKAIVEMKPPRTEKEIQEFLERIQYISKFIAQLTMTCELIFKLLKKEVPTVRNEQCQEAFKKIKSYLMKPPILVLPAPEKPLLLYLTSTKTAMEALLAQYLEETRKENAIYYISKKMLPYEEKYSPLEKICVALVWATCKLRHYMLAYKVFLITRMDPLKYLMEKPVQDRKTAKCVLLLSEFDIKYVTQKSVKGRAIANHLAYWSPKEAEEVQGDFLDEDIMGIEVESLKMYFDGVINQNGSGIGVLLISPKGTHIPFSGRLNFPATNNVTEYEACIMGLQASLGRGVKELELYGGLALIISQIKEERIQNQIADALATTASMMDGSKEDKARSIMLEQKEELAYCMTIEEAGGKNREGEWYSDILQYLKKETYPPSADKNDQLTIRRYFTIPVSSFEFIVVCIESFPVVSEKLFSHSNPLSFFVNNLVYQPIRVLCSHFVKVNLDKRLIHLELHPITLSLALSFDYSPAKKTTRPIITSGRLGNHIQLLHQP